MPLKSILAAIVCFVISSLIGTAAYADPAECIPYSNMWKNNSNPSVEFSESLLESTPLACKQLRTAIELRIHSEPVKPQVLTSRDMAIELTQCKRKSGGVECTGMITSNKTNRFRFGATRFMDPSGVPIWASSVSLAGSEKVLQPGEAYGWMSTKLVADVPTQMIIRFDNVMDPKRIKVLVFDKTAFKNIPWR